MNCFRKIKFLEFLQLHFTILCFVSYTLAFPLDVTPEKPGKISMDSGVMYKAGPPVPGKEMNLTESGNKTSITSKTSGSSPSSGKDSVGYESLEVPKEPTSHNSTTPSKPSKPSVGYESLEVPKEPTYNSTTLSKPSKYEAKRLRAFL
ncbi:hypothetical protein CROQUDRAFT_130993 [Cronartium quercuum f. sp. fusiforme G11]|uniref:Uncharacterized protein n=1 Tax=Cronartium quercuum f. sp. fusiforme G11 TaxID=708437 RepID=A0A9P6TEP7_9BASI|nr:hypothetical protein CROQUDRAFT_130993 [Cronartium quercuum f. sp. fusiforme G11]